jgi:hypothetical protein
MAIADKNVTTLVPTVYTSDVTGSGGTAATATATTSPVEQSASISSTNGSSEDATIPEAPVTNAPSERTSPQYLRAYNMWHHRRKPLNYMCAELTSRGEPLKESTVM